MKKSLCSSLLLIIGVMFVMPAAANEFIHPRDVLPEETSSYSPYVDRKATDRSLSEGLYWGDTHLHSMLSADSGLIGNLVGPEDAYRFARGETVTSSTGQRARLVRPLDFLVVADHAQNFGLAPMLEAGDPMVLETETV